MESLDQIIRDVRYVSRSLQKSPGFAAAALVLARVLSSFSHLLYGVRAMDPLTFLGGSFILMSATVVASFIQARRAARFDPMTALRHD